MPQFAQEYFAKVLPWPQDGDAPAYVNIHWTIDKLNEKTGKPLWTGRAVSSVQEAVKTVDWALSLAETRDIYVCLSTQRNALEKIAKKSGRPYLLPIRAQDNAVALKSIFLDLDAKGEDKNSYASIPDAAKALAEFVKTMDLPKPSAIVNSGGGLHVYWTFDRALTVAEWQPLAFALAEATKRHGLKCDTACTIDAARILRVPGTFNRKLDAARAVALAGGRTGGDYTVDRLVRCLEPYQVATPAPLNVLPPRVPITGPSELSAGIDRGNTAPVDLNDVAVECEFIRNAIATGGKDYSNPLWNLTTLISTFSTGGRSDAHRMAQAHPGYSPASTDELFERKERERQAKGLGWPACRTISGSGFAGCAGCKHFSAGKSPLHTPAPKPVAALLAPPSGAVSNPPANGASQLGNDLPAGYKRLASNIVCQIIINADGSSSDDPISSYPMYDPSIQVQPVYTLNFTTIAESGRATQICVPTKEMSSKDSLRKVLLSQGLALREHESKRAMEFFMSWIEKLQKTKSAVVSSAPFGWSVDNKSAVEGFVYGGSLWMATGNRAAANPDPVLARRYKPTGGIEPWIEAAKLITDQKRPALDAIIASAFAAPLIRFTHEPGVLMSAYSTRSGIGKTTTLKIAQAVWGDPIRAMQGLDDTQNYLFGKVGQLQSLPMYWDELKTEEDTKRFVKTVFKLTARKEKDRMTAAATMRESGSWQTLMACCSNDSIMDHVVQQTKNTAAGIYRVFEYEVPPAKNGVGQIDQADASRIVGKLDDNYGKVGLEYARYLGSNHAVIEKDVEGFYKAIGNEISTSNEERYWRVMLATLLKGAEYANKLGFTEIDGFALKKFLFDVVGGLRDEKKSQTNDMQDTSNLSNVMQQFLNVMRAKHMLKTNRIHTGRGKPALNSITFKSLDPHRLDAIYVHVGTDDKKMRISKTFLTKWLNEHGYAVGPTLKSFATDFGAVNVQGRIASGTDFAGVTEHLLEIDLAQTQQLDFINEA
jgi:hypothetical protein